jgi:hypothetical protein
MYINNWKSKLAEVIMLVICIQEVLGLNLSQDVNYPDKGDTLLEQRSNIKILVEMEKC